MSAKVDTSIHNIPIGSLVEVPSGVRLFVVYHTFDCDWQHTPLYSLSPLKRDTVKRRDGFYNQSWLNGFTEASLRLI